MRGEMGCHEEERCPVNPDVRADTALVVQNVPHSASHVRELDDLVRRVRGERIGRASRKACHKTPPFLRELRGCANGNAVWRDVSRSDFIAGWVLRRVGVYAVKTSALWSRRVFSGVGRSGADANGSAPRAALVLGTITGATGLMIPIDDADIPDNTTIAC